MESGLVTSSGCSETLCASTSFRLAYTAINTSHLLFGCLAAVQTENALRRCNVNWTRLQHFHLKDSDGVGKCYHRISSKQKKEKL